MEHILEVSGQTPPCHDKTPPHVSDKELDLATGRATALDLLSAMFGEANDDWGGVESVDSDVKMAGDDTGIPHAASGPLDSTDLDVFPAAQ